MCRIVIHPVVDLTLIFIGDIFDYLLYVRHVGGLFVPFIVILEVKRIAFCIFSKPVCRWRSFDE